MAKNVSFRNITYHCTASLAMDLVGGKWKVVILFYLRDQELRYSELRKEMPDITEMTLSLQLKQLEADGLLTRTVYGQKPPVKVVYKLTPFGRSFVPVLEAINNWGHKIVREKGKYA
ncbi:MAG: helix-turn-helix domain-containing protein [Chitinophagaceae bacterium]